MHSEIGKYRKMTDAEIAAAFDANYQPVTESGCWIWGGYTTKNGYPTMAQKYMHRYSYQRFNGEIPVGLHVMHKCDVPSCVNPQHLTIGTHQDNHADKVRKGRASGGSSPGELHPMHKLTKADVEQIRKEYAGGGVTQCDLASRYGVKQGTISSIVRGASWRAV